jgi:hypothetical protein
MKYLSYLLKNRSVLLFVFYLNLFTISIGAFIISNAEYVIYESSEFVFAVLLVLVIAIFVTGNAQPYQEWKDGINRKR